MTDALAEVTSAIVRQVSVAESILVEQKLLQVDKVQIGSGKLLIIVASIRRENIKRVRSRVFQLIYSKAGFR